MNREKNQKTQPFRSHPVFNNWEVVTKGWYLAMPSAALKKAPHSMDLCGQRVVLFRGQSGEVYCTDGFCPHMGVDLGLGKVCGENIRCFFHHWQFDGKGKCQHIPSGQPEPRQLYLRGYAVEERYGFIWVWPESKAPYPVPELPELEGSEVDSKAGLSYQRSCHYHVTMINGIDPQHLSTVHNIHMDMNVNMDQTEPTSLHIVLTGKIPQDSFVGRLMARCIGDSYSYGMKYVDATVGLLTTLKDVKAFGKYRLPAVHTIFAYSQVELGKSKVTPIFVTKRRKGFLGKALSWLLLNSAKWGFHFLQGEDGKVYENIRFNSAALQPMDRPVARFISYVNSLQPSDWSRQIVNSMPSQIVPETQQPTQLDH
ncbi:MAG: aromatic ring-hydroxylating dioxygenase subunit alpha [Bdellovibrionales bacterium]|nr:aromatic ring-hydroxylating dioxygenase subunit alpha [Bdellovibrionales bacterium]